MMELATKTKTAESRIGSQRVARGTMCSLLRTQTEYCFEFEGEGMTVGGCGQGLNLSPQRALRITKENLHVRMESSRRLRWNSAPCCMNAEISGCGLPSRDDSCGWKSVAMKNWCVGDSMARHSPSELRATMGKPASMAIHSNSGFIS